MWNARKLYVSSGFLEQEFEGMLSNADRMDEDPSPLLYMDGQVSPFLRTNYGMDLAVKIRCMIVHKLLTKYKTEIDECRLLVARRGVEIGTKNNQPQTIQIWNEVIEALEG